MEVDIREAMAAEGLRRLEMSALPTGLDWHIWWNEQLARKRLGATFDPWEQGLVDSVTRLVRNQLTLARLLRYQGGAKAVIQYDSDGQVQHEATTDAGEMTREALAWFIHAVKPGQKDAPEHLHILFRAIEGCFIQQARIGLEINAIKRKGYLTLNHSATVAAPSDKEIADKGLDAFGKFTETGKERE